jgi:hypothetical protein
MIFIVLFDVGKKIGSKLVNKYVLIKIHPLKLKKHKTKGYFDL